jgi:hypothetical protein
MSNSRVANRHAIGKTSFPDVYVLKERRTFCIVHTMPWVSVPLVTSGKSTCLNRTEFSAYWHLLHQVETGYVGFSLVTSANVREAVRNWWAALDDSTLSRELRFGPGSSKKSLVRKKGDWLVLTLLVGKA